jgi:hypothetical protein
MMTCNLLVGKAAVDPASVVRYMGPELAGWRFGLEL